MIEEVLGKEFICNSTDDQVVPLQKFENNKIALLFSAGWCPPCIKFLDRLTSFYNDVNKDHKRFEVIYVSGKLIS